MNGCISKADGFPWGSVATIGERLAAYIVNVRAIHATQSYLDNFYLTILNWSSCLVQTVFTQVQVYC